MKVIGLAMLAACLASASELLINGDFEQDFSTGWQQYIIGANDTLARGIGYYPDPDYEAYAFRDYGSGYVKLSQLVLIPETNIQFSVFAKIYAYDNNADTLCWAAAAVVISYLDQNNQVLGATKIAAFTSPCPWINTPTVHLISVPDSLWNGYGFNVTTELTTNLPGIDPAAVKKIDVALFDTTAHSC